eukprot:gene36244-43967_t
MRTLKYTVLALALVLLLLPAVICKTASEILSSMSLEAKVGQMVQIDIAQFMVKGTAQVDYNSLHDYIQQYQIGSILNSPFSGGAVEGITGWTASEWRELLQKIQQYASETSSGVPIIYGIDSIHGATFVKGAALFPQALNLAATFNPTLAYNAGKITAKDTRAAGMNWIFAPVLGLGLQPLWARFPETFGEDMLLAATMGSNIIKGMQDVVADGGMPRQAAACMKHFIGYSLPTNGHDRSPVQLPDRILRQLYVPSFKAAVDAGVLTAMESYNEVGGIPMVSSPDYLNTLIRKEMQFSGFMVTDYAEIENLHNWHRVVSTQREGVKLTLTQTSVDMSMVPLDTSFYEYVLDLVRSGEVSEDRINESVARILAVKEKLGMLEEGGGDVPTDDPNIATVGQDEDWQASLDTARESIVLAQNNNNALPLKTTQNIFLTGPTCNSTASLTGGWAVHWQGMQSEGETKHHISILDALTDATIFPSTATITYLPGVDVYADNLDGVDMTAVYAAMDAADVVVVCVGEGTYAEKPGDIDDLALPSGQTQYVLALSQHAPATPLVSVMVAGRPRLFNEVVSVSSGVVLAMQPGPMGGQAVVEVLTGAVNPSGRLPFSYPRYSGDVVYPYHRKPSEMCTQGTVGTLSVTYIPCVLQFPFGTGLSYTTWEYSTLTLSSTSMSESQTIDVSVQVTNTGTVAGLHTVMLFLYDLYRLVTPEYKRLIKFSKVSLAPGQSTTVSFTISSTDLEYVGRDSHYVLEGGDFKVGVSPYTDCRDGGAAGESINTADSTSTSSMCASFALNLSPSYSA